MKAAVALSRITTWISGQSVIPLLPLLIGVITTHYAISLATAGLVASTQILSSAVGSLTASRLIDKHDARNMVILAAFMAITGNLIAAFTDSLSMLFVSRVISGLAEGSLMALAAGAAAVSGRTEHVFGGYKICFGLFAVPALLVTPGLIGAYGIKGGFLLLAGVNVVTLLFALAAFPRKIEAAGETHGASVKRRSKLFYVTLCIALILSVVGVMGMQTFVERIGIEVIGIDIQLIGNILAVAAATAIFAPILVMYLVKKGVGRAVPLTVAGTLHVVALSVLALHPSLPSFVFAVLAIMPFILFTQPYQIGLLADLDPSGKLAAAAPGFLALGAAIGPALAGAFSEQIGLQYISLLAAGLTLVSYLVLVNAARQTDTKSSPGH